VRGWGRGAVLEGAVLRAAGEGRAAVAVRELAVATRELAEEPALAAERPGFAGRAGPDTRRGARGVAPG
jgi:hypothetical protein